MQNRHIVNDPKELFRRWYEVPLAMLATIENGDGGFIALATALYLFERYVQTGKAKQVHKPEIAKELSHQLDIDEQVAKDFWEIFRPGLLHAGTPKHTKDLPGYLLTHRIEIPILMDMIEGRPVILVQPWLFVRKVLDLWRQQPERLNELVDNPFPIIFSPKDTLLSPGRPDSGYTN